MQRASPTPVVLCFSPDLGWIAPDVGVRALDVESGSLDVENRALEDENEPLDVERALLVEECPALDVGCTALDVGSGRLDEEPRALDVGGCASFHVTGYVEIARREKERELVFFSNPTQPRHFPMGSRSRRGLRRLRVTKGTE